MVILRTRNKITDFLMILAWASPFNPNLVRRYNDYALFFLIAVSVICPNLLLCLFMVL